MDVKKKAFEKIRQFHSTLINRTEYNVSEIENKNYNYEFTVSSPATKEKLKVLVYFGKKGLRTVFQGNDSTQLYKEISNLLMEEPELEFDENELKEPDEYIGTDETGKGDFFGPLVIAAMYVDKNTQTELKKMGVRDSKMLTANQILRLANDIKSRFLDDFEIIFISPGKYNELYENFGNLNKLLDWAHSKAIENLLKRKKCKTIITDKFSKSALAISNSIENSHIEFHTIPKAEKYTGVAAASILAREQMLNWFAKLENEGIALPKGSSNNIEATANEIISKFGKDKLREIAKLHFKTTKKLNT